VEFIVNMCEGRSQAWRPAEAEHAQPGCANSVAGPARVGLMQRLHDTVSSALRTARSPWKEGRHDDVRQLFDANVHREPDNMRAVVDTTGAMHHTLSSREWKPCWSAWWRICRRVFL
jgi:hypothetical protein